MDESLVDWDALQALLAVAEVGSLRGAAARLGISQPTLGRRLRALEDALGTVLAVRHARGVELTAEGRMVVDRAEHIASEVDGLRRALSGRREALVGRVRVSCTEPVAMEVLPPILLALGGRHPGVAVDVVVDAHASDLDRREADVAIRMFQPRGARLVARRVGTSGTAFYASPDLVARVGRPASFEDLPRFPLLGPDRDPLFVRAAREMGFDLDTCRHRTDSFGVTLRYARAGLGIGALVTSIADRDPGLVQVLPPFQEYPVWLVTHPDLLGSAVVRVVWDAFADALPEWFGAGPG
ncbi:MAG: LysR family transcriptional regulator [Alphaproteobacteria bacterium]|nr:LysR family transcriptional regulator [Alphaproteobacteria bacterium]